MLIKRVNQRKLASERKKRYVEVDYSKHYLPILDLITDNGYIKGWVTEKKGENSIRKVYLRYYLDGTSSRSKRKMRWKPSRSISVNSQQLWGVNGEVGIYFIQTTKGRITSVDARRQKLGGVLLRWVI